MRLLRIVVHGRPAELVPPASDRLLEQPPGQRKRNGERNQDGCHEESRREQEREVRCGGADGLFSEQLPEGWPVAGRQRLVRHLEMPHEVGKSVEDGVRVHRSLSRHGNRQASQGKKERKPEFHRNSLGDRGDRRDA